MISTLFQGYKLTKRQKKKFIPFVNQRDFMGGLILEETKTVKNQNNNISNNLAIIQNLKKTTKEYFFDKKYDKMVSKLKKIQGSLSYKEPDYEDEVNHCLKIMGSSLSCLNKRNAEEKYYIDLHEELSQKISGLKDNLIKKIMVKKSQTQQKKRFKPTSLSAQFDQKQKYIKRHATVEKQNWESKNTRKITKQVFKQIGNKASEMTDFTNAGLKYKTLVENRKINPWKKWYEKEEVQLFPGQKIMLKKLKKSIY